RRWAIGQNGRQNSRSQISGVSALGQAWLSFCDGM
ncbi:uncharacterized protein METZ01_LOCUS405911, partial [marine metagenome]